MRLPRYDFDPSVVNPELAEALDYVRMILNYGKYQLNIVTSVPSWDGEEGETVIYNAGGTKWLYTYIDSGWHKVELTAA